jgi:hypothetical protein
VSQARCLIDLSEEEYNKTHYMVSEMHSKLHSIHCQVRKLFALSILICSEKGSKPPSNSEHITSQIVTIVLSCA